jgi:chemotaxis protein MotB
MFPEGSKEPYERTRRLVQRIAAQLKAMPYRVAISGHTAASKIPSKPGYGPWDLSADRANAIRQILEAEGVPVGHFYQVSGRADTQPLFPDNPFVASNRRVTILLMREAPPIPVSMRP